MSDCDQLERTTAYFDGALPPGEETAAIEHLGTCAACQRVLGDAVAIDAVLSTEAQAPAAVRVPRRRRWPLVVAVVGGLAAAAAVLYVVIPRSEPAPQLAALPAERALEARFTGARFAPHRPYGVLRGDRAVEAISLTTLAELEQRGRPADLVAALAATGDLARAREVAEQLPATPAAESDRAALALAAGDAERALEHAYRALQLEPDLAAARWNLGLAARALGLPRVSHAAFARIAEVGEPGWATEARAQLTALERALAPDREFAAFDARARAMVAGGPPITVADVQRFPGFARVYVIDALRVAAGAGVEPLRPLAAELDTQSGAPTMAAAADRAAAADPAVRARFADRYRAVVARTASAAQIAQLVDELRAAGPAVDDIRASTIITGGRARARLDELRAIVAPWRDPWFDLVVERERIRTSFAPGDLRAEPALAQVLASCSGDAWSLRCGQLAQDLAELLRATGRVQDAEPVANRAIEWFRRAVAPNHLQTARSLVADLHRLLGRSALSRAAFEEVSLVEDASCALRRYATIALADLALAAGAWARVRGALPDAVPPAGCATAVELQGLTTAGDLARRTGEPEDLEVARRWIAAAPAIADVDRDGIAAIAAARIARGADVPATAAVHAWLAAHPPSAEAAHRAAIRTWGFTTLIADAGWREAWDEVVELAATEHPAAARGTCTVVASVDDGALTVAARTPAGTLGRHRRVEPAELSSTTIVPPELARSLASCAEISVDARPPLHGRADLLPPELTWWFAGDAPAHAPGRPARAIEVTSPRPPDTSLPPLPDPGTSAVRFDATISGPDATPSRVLAALADATYAELHVHGVAAAALDGAAFLALSPEASGTFALRADRVRSSRLGRGPVVVLAACRAATVAPYLRERWSLPDAFLAAGAHAVVAADVPISDASARRVFDELHRRIDAGESAAAAVAALRASARGETAWARRLMVFR